MTKETRNNQDLAELFKQAAQTGATVKVTVELQKSGQNCECVEIQNPRQDREWEPTPLTDRPWENWKPPQNGEWEPTPLGP
jgi:hypothetical protein